MPLDAPYKKSEAQRTKPETINNYPNKFRTSIFDFRIKALIIPNQAQKSNNFEMSNYCVRINGEPLLIAIVLSNTPESEWSVVPIVQPSLFRYETS